MKAFKIYASIFRKPIIVSIVLILSFFIFSVVLLLGFNDYITSRINYMLSRNESMLFMTFDIQDAKASDVNTILRTRGENYYEFSYMDDTAIEPMIIAAVETNRPRRENYLLKAGKKGVIITSNLLSDLEEDRSEAELPQEIEILGRTFNIIGEHQSPTIEMNSKELFELAKGKMISVTVGLPSFPELDAFENLATMYRKEGVQISNLSLPDWKNEEVKGFKLDFLAQALIIVSFLIVNLLFVYDYILRTRSHKLQMLRLLGLNRFKSRLFVSFEIALYLIIGFALAAGVSLVLFQKEASYLTVYDYLWIFLLLLSLSVVGSYLVSGWLLPKDISIGTKENFHV